jgi:hypothetical protein
MTYQLSINGGSTEYETFPAVGKAIADTLREWAKLTACPTHGNYANWGCRESACTGRVKAIRDADLFAVGHGKLPYIAVLPGGHGVDKRVIHASQSAAVDSKAA